MPDFELSYLADQDIAEIIDYTVGRWGADQAALYANLLDQHFKQLAMIECYPKPFLIIGVIYTAAHYDL